MYTSPLARPSGNCPTVALHGQCLRSRREFDPATDSEADVEEDEVAHHSSESGDDDELENEEEMTGGKKKRTKLAQKDFVEVERWLRWDRMEMSDGSHSQDGQARAILALAIPSR